MIYKCRENELRITSSADFRIFMSVLWTQKLLRWREVDAKHNGEMYLIVDDTSSSNASFGVIGDDFNCARVKSRVFISWEDEEFVGGKWEWTGEGRCLNEVMGEIREVLGN